MPLFLVASFCAFRSRHSVPEQTVDRGFQVNLYKPHRFLGIAAQRGLHQHPVFVEMVTLSGHIGQIEMSLAVALRVDRFAHLQQQ
ncbi:MAG: hypothetical protein ABSF41_15145, partial [Pseudolabrys sp.]